MVKVPSQIGRKLRFESVVGAGRVSAGCGDLNWSVHGRNTAETFLFSRVHRGTLLISGRVLVSSAGRALPLSRAAETGALGCAHVVRTGPVTFPRPLDRARDRSRLHRGGRLGGFALGPPFGREPEGEGQLRYGAGLTGCRSHVGGCSAESFRVTPTGGTRLHCPRCQAQFGQTSGIESKY